MRVVKSEMYTIDDIQIFIATHNRADYLKQSLESILNQSAGVKEVIVLDNESTDNTEEVIRQYAERNVKYIKTYGFLGNYKKAKEIVNKKYCMVFHDDDILHPDYLKTALKLLNKHENIALITTRFTHFLDSQTPEKFNKVYPDYYLYESQKDFATNIFFLEEIAYAPAIYRTSDFLKEDLEFDKFNKYNDLPFMIKMSKHGKTIFINSYDLFYTRIHQYQDSCIDENQPTFEQIFNWNQFFYDIFKNSNDKNLIWNYKRKSEHYLKIRWDNCVSENIKNSLTYHQYLDNAKSNGLEELCTDISQMPSETNYKKFITYVMKKDLQIHPMNIISTIVKGIISHKTGKAYWLKYFKKYNEQKYLDNLAEKLKNKKVLLYGYGIVGQLIIEKYDLSKFNIVAISDKKFETSKAEYIGNYKVVAPKDIKNTDFDVVLSSLCNNISVFCFMNQQNLKQKVYSAIVKN